MNLENSRILIAAQYAAPYEGNFIASLKALRDRLASEFNAECGFLFPKQMNSQQWAKKFINENTVFLSGNSSTVILPEEAEEFVENFQPDLIYTHFEGYDAVMAAAARRFSKSTRVVWHMHDTLTFQPNPLKAMYQVYCYTKHYGLPFINSKMWGG